MAVRSMALVAALLVWVGMAWPQAAAARECSALLDRSLRPLAGKTPESLCQYQGRVLLIVNTASKCGLTPQYEALEALHARLAPQGFAVLGFPSNDFLGQEPGSEEEIQEFCSLTYGVTFPMFEKVAVKGEGRPLNRLRPSCSIGEVLPCIRVLARITSPPKA